MEWKEGRPANAAEKERELNDMKDSLYSTISDLKKKKEELLIKMEEEKAKNG